MVALSLPGCSTHPETVERGGSWVGTITTEGDVTTVINDSGSVWAGTATLVEEASIGVASGRDEYLLDGADETTVFASRELIYVAQPTIPIVRLYDHEGEFLRNLGQEGQGPGEYQAPIYVGAEAQGNTFVYDGVASRVNAYDPDGASIGTWTLPDLMCCIWPPALSPEGALRVAVMTWEGANGPDSPRFGVRMVVASSGPQGEVLWAPDIEYERLTVSLFGQDWEMVPFAPAPRFGITPDGVVAGVSADYRFEVLRTDGTRLIVQRHREPFPVHAEQVEWRRRRVLAQANQLASGSTWIGDDSPAYQPAFDEFLPTASSEIWVLRSGPSRRIRDCVADPDEDPRQARSQPCWETERIIDVFGADGRYHGDVATPPGLNAAAQNLFVRDDLVLGVIEDEEGTVMVKRYRLVLPGEE